MDRINSTFTIENFTPNLGYEDSPQIPEEYRFITEAYKQTWIEIVDLFSNFNVSFEKNQPPIEVTINWESAIQKVKLEEWSSEIQINMSYEINAEDDSTVDHRLEHYAELLLYEIFIIANLSSPGCFDLFHSKFVDRSTVMDLFTLSADRMEASWLLSLQKEFPKIVRVPLKTTYLWYKQLDIGIRQHSKSRLERALFALMHFCNSDSICPSRLIWITHALEALYDTPSSRITKTLNERIFLVLGGPETHSKKIKNEINEIYNLRSRFVHGDLNIVHPISNDIFDETILDYNEKIVDSYRLSLAIIIATMQKHIVNGWGEISFCESYQGKR